MGSPIKGNVFLFGSHWNRDTSECPYFFALIFLYTYEYNTLKYILGASVSIFMMNSRRKPKKWNGAGKGERNTIVSSPGRDLRKPCSREPGKKRSSCLMRTNPCKQGKGKFLLAPSHNFGSGTWFEDGSQISLDKHGYKPIIATGIGICAQHEKTK